MAKSSEKSYRKASASIKKASPSKWPWEPHNAKTKKAAKKSTTAHTNLNKRSDKRK